MLRAWAFSIYKNFPGEKRVPFNSGPFAAQWLRFYAPKFKNVAVNTLEVVRPFKSCKWNTHFHRKVSNGKTGLPFQKFRLFRKFSSATNQKCVFHLHPNRNFRNFLVNGKRPVSRVSTETYVWFLGVQGWRSGESTHLPPLWPRFDSQIQRHMCVEFVCSLLCTERFFSGYSGFPLSSKTDIWFDLL